MQTRDIVLIGSSLGGIEALSTLVSQIPGDFPAAIFIVQHTSPESPGLLSQILSRKGPLPAALAEDQMEIRPGQILIAPPDRHLLVTGAGVRIVFGPRENYSRPAIDPLFRTGAVHFRNRVIGVILTGLMGDGAAGLQAVQRCGGAAVVQSPSDAAHPEMPLNALAAVDVNHEVPLREMGSLLGRLVSEAAPPAPEIPRDLLIEARLTERAMLSADWREVSGRPTLFTCPECGGMLQEIGDEQLRRYRCHVGHAFTGDTVLGGQERAVEDALWVALRTLEERARMLETMAEDERQRGHAHAAESYQARASESRSHETQIRALIERLTSINTPD